MSAPTIEELLAEPVDARHRAFGAVALGTAVGALGARRFDVGRGDLPLPLLALRESALAHNLRVMHEWCAERDLSLAPHGKTAMAPQLVRRQLAAGAWGMTAATVQQVAVMRAAGATRVILANEVVGSAELAWLAAERAAGVEVFVLVDSEAGVRLLDEGMAAASPESPPLPVLIELGGTRAGCRTDAQALAVADAVAAAPRLALAGVEGFEGTVGADREPATLAAVDAFLDRFTGLVEALDRRGAFAQVPEILATAGGSALFDRVAARLRFPAPLSRPVRVVLRSGCYLTHDDGLYARTAQLPLRPALELWARVLSCPEPGLAIAGFGKRDAPYDLGLPVVREVRRDGTDPEGLVVTALNDQHAFIRDARGTLRVGDAIVCGISHPCTAFDKWSLIPVLDDDDVVIEAIRTVF
jgi:D-serine dehydratase